MAWRDRFACWPCYAGIYRVTIEAEDTVMGALLLTVLIALIMVGVLAVLNHFPPHTRRKSGPSF